MRSSNGRSSSLTPIRRRGIEYLDEPNVSADLLRRSLSDVARANTLFGGTRAVLRELMPVLRAARGDSLTLLDVGTGAADIPTAARALAERLGVRLTVVGADTAEPLAHSAAPRLDGSICADARALPFPSHSVDVVVCSQLLHHFTELEMLLVLRELHRVARERVIVSDLRRSWAAAAGIWLASFPLRFHPVSRHDGVVSVLRGFTPRELHDHVRMSTGATPVVRRHMGWRVTASWSPRS
jgi:2-polyprenyl-3-methyl-5-hydroxy-6-metoxy-1,4-benzoquinol methylase